MSSTSASGSLSPQQQQQQLSRDAGPPMAVRTTQRAPKSCAACTRRKVKCSKTIPCVTCLERGKGAECRRETVAVKGRIRNTSVPRTPDVNELQLEVIRLKARIRQLEGDRDKDDDAPELDNLDSLIKGLETMSMGMSALPTIPRAPRRSTAFHLPSHPLPEPRDVLRAVLPPRAPTDALLEWAHAWTAWHACVYHVPIFRDQTRRMWDSGGASTYWGWCAVLLGVLAEALFYIDEADARAMGFSTEQIQTLPDIWCRASLHCLLHADVLGTHTLISMQAIVTIAGVANALGHSTLHTTLIPLGIAIAQSLKLSRLGAEPVCALHAPGAPCAAHGGVALPHFVSDIDCVRRELGRRAWLSLAITARLSWQARDGQGLPDAGTSLPAKIVDVEMGEVAVVLPVEQPTVVSHLLAMYECSSVVVDHLTTRDAPLAALDKVDHRLQRLLYRPCYLPDSLPYMAWARHVWVLVVHHKRLVLHRPYFARSFRNPKYARARAVCVDAARAILAERRKVFPSPFEKVWSTMFHTLAAAVILAIDYFHAPVTGLDTRRAEIFELLEALNRGLQNNAYVKRSTNLLLSLLAEEDKFRAAAAAAAAAAAPLPGPTMATGAATGTGDSFADAPSSSRATGAEWDTAAVAQGSFDAEPALQLADDAALWAWLDLGPDELIRPEELAGMTLDGLPAML